MKVPLVCRSCASVQAVDLTAIREAIVCPACEHESSAGDPALRQSIQRRQAKVRTLTVLATMALGLSLALVFLGVTSVEGGLILWLGAGAAFLASAVVLVLAERQREVVYF